MTLRETLVLSTEFEAFSDMIRRIEAFETEDELLRDRLAEIRTSMEVTRLYMLEKAARR
jgi:hypothetical protein